MTQKELVAQLRESASGIERFVYDANKESLRRLALELDYILYGTIRKLARESFCDFDQLKLEIYSDLADELSDIWDDETLCEYTIDESSIS